MKAILLAAGLGTRLRPITNSIPKCLVPINGVPLLQLWLDKLVALGVEEILINTHYLAEQIYDFINSYPNKNIIKLVYESQLLGTGGTLVNNSNFWKGEECWIIHADNFFTGSLHGMLTNHRKHKDHDVSLLLFETDQPQNCGIVTVDGSGLIQSFHEKVPNPPGNLASGALFLFKKGVYRKYFSQLETDIFIDLSKDIAPMFVGAMRGWFVEAPYIDIGTPTNYKLAQEIQKNMAD